MGTTGLERTSSRTWWVEWHDSGKPQRVELTGRLTVGRSRHMDVVIDDPYVSREHCTLELDADGVRVDASHSTNLICVDGRDMKCAMFRRAGSFSIGQTTVQLRPASVTQDTTLHMSRTTPTLTLRRSTRELLSADGTLIAQLSMSEAAALEAIVTRFPDAADHATISRAIWGEPDYPRYLIHRLIQRLRDRMGDFADLIENVRGAGYRLRGPMDLR
ncbi:MAG: FHA domain-containing protein [Candidatus Limnocylindrales bacterium]